MSNNEKKEVLETLKEIIGEKGAELGMRLATDEEMASLLEKGKEAYENARAEMDKPDYGAKLLASREAWYKKAKAQTLESLPAFLSELAGHSHDYNTIVHAVAAAAIGAARAIDHSPNGGITGFQAGAVFWEFFGEWLGEKGKPARIVKYENMLFPQYEHEFEKVLSPDAWKWLQEKAAEKLAASRDTSPTVSAHWRSIVQGRVPFGYVVKS